MSPTEDQKALKSLIQRRHPEYAEQLRHWQFLAACYKGARTWFSGNIFRYIKEGDKEYRDRVERAYRFNHSREIVDLINKYIFKAQVVRNTTDAPTEVTEFWKTATRDRQPIGKLMQEISRRSSISGRVWVVVDSTASEQVQTKADEKALNARTYAYAVDPIHALDMSYDEEGRLNWILLMEIGRNDKDPMADMGDPVIRYRLWTRTQWFLFEEVRKGAKLERVELKDEGEHGVGEVPVFAVDHIESDEPYAAPSLIGDIAYLDRATANYLSNLDAIIQDQTFSQLVIPAQGLMPGDEGIKQIVEMGTKRIFTYDGEQAGHAPAYISPDAQQVGVIIATIQQIINEIYHSVGVSGERTKQDNSSGIDNSSGVAKAYDFERVNALLCAKAESLDRAEKTMIRLVMLWNSSESSDIDLVKYADNFDVRGLHQEMDVAERLSMLSAPKMVRQEQMRLVIEKLFPRLARDIKERMLKEMETAWPADPMDLLTEPPSGSSTDTDQTGDGQEDQD